MRFKYRNFKFKISLNCTDGTTLPQYGIYKQQNTGTKLNKSISSAHSILPKNAFNIPNDHEHCVHYLCTWGLPLINWYPMSKHSSQLRLIRYLHHTSSILRQLPLELLSEIFNEGGIKIISLSNIRPIIYFDSSQCRLIPYLHQRPIFFKANSIHSSIVAIL